MREVVPSKEAYKYIEFHHLELKVAVMRRWLSYTMTTVHMFHSTSFVVHVHVEYYMESHTHVGLKQQGHSQRYNKINRISIGTNICAHFTCIPYSVVCWVSFGTFTQEEAPLAPSPLAGKILNIPSHTNIGG